ncbi:MAG: metal ABC transporter substrate-binding protein [Coriobacteriales bacterium]|jgi:D-methionine transport system substrate-binding protein|nr:metal ABC transporter substrate-binding protein [Coriobacteriales bacterium]
MKTTRLHATEPRPHRRAQTAFALAAALLLVLSAALLAGCASEAQADDSGSTPAGGTSSTPAAATKLVVGAAQVPHAELLEFVKPALAEQGVDLEVIVPTDESNLNQLTENKEIDVNFFQHKPYLDSVVAEKGYQLVSVGGIHVEPIGAYSDRYASTAQLPDNATVAIPNDATNEYRALRILEEAGLIKLKSNIDPVTTTKGDIESYLKPLTIVELEAGLIVRTHDEYDLYITNTNRVIEGGLDASSYLFREGANSPYANIVVTRAERANEPAVQALYRALRTPEVKSFIEDKYQGAVVPAF